MKAVLFDIQHFSIHDGPGIRTTVFFKGCPLRCRWCHNPEGLTRVKELSFIASKCTYCGRCAKACPNGVHTILLPEGADKPVHLLARDRCAACGACANACLRDALTVSGKEWEIDDVIADVMKDEIFYETSKGGVTLSGGEPLAQPDAALALLKAAKEKGLHTCIETSGYCSEEVLRSVIPYIDLFLLDYKETDPERHLAYTGVSNERPRASLDILASVGKPAVLRCPIIPGLNDRQDHYDGAAAAANAHPNIIEVNIEPYHPLGISKSANFGKEVAYDNPSFMDKDKAKEIAAYIGGLVSVPVKVM